LCGGALEASREASGLAAGPGRAGPRRFGAQANQAHSAPAAAAVVRTWRTCPVHLPPNTCHLPRHPLLPLFPRIHFGAAMNLRSKIEDWFGRGGFFSS